MSTYKKLGMIGIVMILLAGSVYGAGLADYREAFDSPVKSLINGVVLFFVAVIVYQILFRNINVSTNTLNQKLFYSLAGVIALLLGFSTKGTWIWSYLFAKDSWSIITWMFVYNDSFTIKPTVNILVSWLIVYILFKIVPGIKNIAEKENALRVVICLIIAILFAYSTANVSINNGAYINEKDVFIWSSDNGNSILDYFFGSSGLLRGDTLFVFIGSIFLLFLLTKAIYPGILDKEPVTTWILIIMLSSSISSAGLSLGIFLNIAFWTLLILFYKSLNTGMNNPGLAFGFSFAVMNTVAKSAFNEYITNFIPVDSFIANFGIGYAFGLVFLTGFFENKSLFSKLIERDKKKLESEHEEFEAVSEILVAKSKVFDEFLIKNYAIEIAIMKEREKLFEKIKVATNIEDINTIRANIESNFKDEIYLRDEFEKVVQVSNIDKQHQSTVDDAQMLRNLLKRLANEQK